MSEPAKPITPSNWEKLTTGAADITRPLHDFAASCNSSRVAKLCRAAWNHPVEFTGRTLGAAVVAAVGLVAGAVTFAYWPYFAFLGAGIMVCGGITGNEGLFGLGVGVALGPVTTAAATVAIITAIYADFIETDNSEIETKTETNPIATIITRLENP